MSNRNGGVAGGTAHVAVTAATPHRECAPYLRDRGFDAETVAAAGWRVEPLGERCRRYGLPTDAAGAMAWFIPYRHPNGRIAFERIRLIDPAELERHGGGKYRQPADWSRGAGERGLALYDPFCALEAEGPVDAIILIEGEANAVTLYQLGVASPSVPVVGLPGQGVLSAELARELGHAPVVLVWIDRGDPGAGRNADRIAEHLAVAGVADVRFVDDTAGMDANDVLQAFGPERALELVRGHLDAARPLERAGESRPAAGSWPEPLHASALYGLAGDVVRAIEPHSESDPAALLAQFLVMFGNAAGRGAGFRAEADHHGVNLYALLVGETAKGRKGSSWGHIRRLLGMADERWEKDRVQGGLSSGEGLIWAVRDPILKPSKLDEDDAQEEAGDVLDAGVADKRLLAHESEFASVLRVARRDGNTLSTVMRKAWDGTPLQVMTKNSPAKATGAHVSIVGHVTRDELRRELNATEAANGFANRYLFVCVGRSKYLPDGGSLKAADLEPLAERVLDALRFARVTEEMKRDSDARALWHEVYAELSDARPGLVGAVTTRAEAQVMRLACVYALLDLSGKIGREHLEAGLAVWQYCEASARHIFGDSLGDPFADEILYALRAAAPRGLTRTELRDHFHRHRALASSSARSGSLSRRASSGASSSSLRAAGAPTGGRRDRAQWGRPRDT